MGLRIDFALAGKIRMLFKVDFNAAAVIMYLFSFQLFFWFLFFLLKLKICHPQFYKKKKMVMSRTELKPWQNGIEILEKVQKWVYFLENTLFSSGVMLLRIKHKNWGYW